MTTLYEGTSQIQKLIIGRAATGINALVPVLIDRRRRRRRHDGRRHRAARRARRARARCCTTRAGRARARAGRHRASGSSARSRRGGCEAGAAGRLEGAPELGGAGRRRPRHRGGARVARAQARAVRRASPRSSREDCVLATNTSSIPSPRSPPAARARARRRHALLQPGAGDEAGRGHRGRAVGRGGARDGARARRGDGQARDRRGRRPRLPRQPLRPPVRARGAAARAGAGRDASSRSTASAASAAASAWARSS